MRSLAGQGPIPGIFIEIFDTPLGQLSLPLPPWMRSSPQSELDRRYALTPMGALLRDGSVGSMRPWAIFCGEELGRAWSAGLLTAVRTGAPAFGAAQAGAAGADPALAAEDFWGYMSRNPAARETFDASMQALSAYTAAPGEAADRYDWTLGGRARWIVDVGGGTGLFIAGILAKHPVCAPPARRRRAAAARGGGGARRRRAAQRGR
jgi:multifunctional cyclase/dehydratase/O-methyltransferase